MCILAMKCTTRDIIADIKPTIADAITPWYQPKTRIQNIPHHFKILVQNDKKIIK